MAQFEVMSPSGQKYLVEAPDNASQADLISAVKQKETPRQSIVSASDLDQISPRKQSYGTMASRSLSRGASRVGNTLWNETPALLQSFVGNNNAAIENLKKAKEWEEDLQYKNPKQYQSWKDVNGVGDLAGYVLENSAEQVANIGLSLATGIGGGTLARAAISSGAKKAAENLAEKAIKNRIAGPIQEAVLNKAKKSATNEIKERASHSGSLLGSFVGSFIQNAPDTFNNIYQKTGKLEPTLSIIAGSMQAALDSILPYKLSSPEKAVVTLKLLQKSGMEPKLLKTVGKEILKDSGIEGLTEAAQEAIGIKAEKIIEGNKAAWTSEDYQRIVESFVGGAAGSLPFSGYGGARKHLAEKGAYNQAKLIERLKQEAEDKAQRDQEKAAQEAERLQNIPAELDSIEAELSTHIEALNADPANKTAQVKKEILLNKRKKLLEEQQLLNMTPEQRKEYLNKAKQDQKSAKDEDEIESEQKDPKDFTVSDMLKELGITKKEAVKVAKANNLFLKLDEKAEGGNAESFLKFLNVITPDDVGDIAALKDTDQYEKVALDFAERADNLRKLHPNLQPESIEATKYATIKSNKFGDFWKSVLSDREITDETAPEIVNDISKMLDSIGESNQELSSFLKNKIKNISKLRNAVMNAAEGEVEAPNTVAEKKAPAESTEETELFGDYEKRLIADMHEGKEHIVGTFVRDLAKKAGMSLPPINPYTQEEDNKKIVEALYGQYVKPAEAAPVEAPPAPAQEEVAPPAPAQEAKPETQVEASPEDKVSAKDIADYIGKTDDLQDLDTLYDVILDNPDFDDSTKETLIGQLNEKTIKTLDKSGFTTSDAKDFTPDGIKILRSKGLKNIYARALIRTLYPHIENLTRSWSLRVKDVDTTPPDSTKKRTRKTVDNTPENFSDEDTQKYFELSDSKDDYHAIETLRGKNAALNHLIGNIYSFIVPEKLTKTQKEWLAKNNVSVAEETETENESQESKDERKDKVLRDFAKRYVLSDDFGTGKNDFGSYAKHEYNIVDPVIARFFSKSFGKYGKDFWNSLSEKEKQYVKTNVVNLIAKEPKYSTNKVTKAKEDKEPVVNSEKLIKKQKELDEARTKLANATTKLQAYLDKNKDSSENNLDVVDESLPEIKELDSKYSATDKADTIFQLQQLMSNAQTPDTNIGDLSIVTGSNVNSDIQADLIELADTLDDSNVQEIKIGKTKYNKSKLTNLLRAVSRLERKISKLEDEIGGLQELERQNKNLSPEEIAIRDAFSVIADREAELVDLIEKNATDKEILKARNAVTNAENRLNSLREKYKFSVVNGELIQHTTVNDFTSEIEKKMGVELFGSDIIVLESPEEMGFASNVKAAVNPNTGKVYFFTNNIEKGKEFGVFLHEIGEHLGMKKTVGEANYEFLLAKIKEWAAKNDGSLESEIAIAALNRIPKSTAVDEELLAYFIEEAVDNFGVKPTEIKETNTPLGIFFKKIFAAFKNVMSKFGFGNPKADSITAKDLVNLAYGAAHLEMVERTNAPTYYSQLAYAISKAKQDVMTSEQWLQWINANAASLGVKKEELEYSGLIDRLSLGRWKYRKEDLIDIVNASLFTNVTLSTTELRTDEYDKNVFPLEEKVRKINKRLDEINENHAEYRELEAELDKIKTKIKEFKNPTKYSNYRLLYPIARTQRYREILSRIPVVDRSRLGGTYPYGKPYKEKYWDFLVTNAEGINRPKVRYNSLAKLRFLSEMRAKYGDVRFDETKEIRDLAIDPEDELRKKLNKKEKAELDRLTKEENNYVASHPIFKGAFKDYTTFAHPHWVDSISALESRGNVLFHYRVSDYNDTNGNLIYFVEELQSDWAQTARKKGITPIERKINTREEVINGKPKWVVRDERGNIRGVGNTKQEAIEDVEFLYEEVPDAPFIRDTEAWLKLALKNIIRDAINNGYSNVAFINGKEAYFRFATNFEGNSTEKGMKTFYDEMLPRALNKILKDLGGPTLSTAKIDISAATPADLNYINRLANTEFVSFTITPEMRAMALGGQPLFSVMAKNPQKFKFSVVSSMESPLFVSNPRQRVKSTKAERQRLADDPRYESELASNVENTYDHIMEIADNAINKAPTWIQGGLKKALAMIENPLGASRGLILSALGYQELADVTGKYSPELEEVIRRIDKIANKRDYEVEQAIKDVANFVDEAGNIINQFPEQIDKFNKISHDSTLQQVEFDDPQFANHPLTKQFETLDPKLQKLYFDVRDRYAAYAKTLIEKIELSETLGPSSKIILKLLSKQIKPYFPLFRKGDYWLEFVDPNTDEEHVASFETENLRREAIAFLKASNAKNIRKFSRIEDVNIESLPPTREFRQVISALERASGKKKVSKDVINEVYRMYLNMFPNSSIMQNFRPRSGTAGFRQDVLTNFAEMAPRMARSLAQFNAIREIDLAMIDARNIVTKRPDPVLADIFKSLKDRENFTKSPIQKGFIGSLANKAGAISYHWFLLGNVSSALVNYSQIPLIVAPMLGPKYGYSETASAISQATKLWWEGGHDHNTTIRNPLTGNKMYDRSMGGDTSNLPANIRRLLDIGMERGAVVTSVGQDLRNVQEVGVGNPTGAWTRIQALMSWLFQNVERHNREVTLVATYNLARKTMSEDQAIEEAVRFTVSSHGAARQESGPQILQEGIGKILGTFKRIQFAMIYLNYRLFSEMINGVDSDTKIIATKQFFGINFMALMFAGLAGLPVFGAAEMLASLLNWVLNKIKGKDQPPFDLKRWIYNNGGDFWANGAVGALTGVDISNRVAFGNMLWRPDDKALADLGPFWYMVHTAAGPIGGVATNIQNGVKLINEGQIMRGIEAASPTYIKNALKSYRYAFEGAYTTKGKRIAKDVDGIDIAMQFAGLSPKAISDEQMKANWAAKDITYFREQRNSILARANLAAFANDYKELNRIKTIEKERFNRSKGGQLAPITESTFRKSFDQWEEKSQYSIGGYSVPKKYYERRMDKEN